MNIPKPVIPRLCLVIMFAALAACGARPASSQSRDGDAPRKRAGASTQRPENQDDGIGTGIGTGVGDDTGTAVRKGGLKRLRPAAMGYYLTVIGTDFVSVADGRGNSNTTIDDTFAMPVPGIGYHLLGENAVMVTAPTHETYTYSFRPVKGSVTVELVKGVGNSSPVMAVRYVDVVLPPGGLFKLVTSPAGAAALRYDADGDGVFETHVEPTASVTGAAAADTSGPSISISARRLRDSSAVVTITAEDAGAGVKAVYYSLNGSDFQVYAKPFSVDPSLTPKIHAFADDRVGNRSAWETFSFERQPPAEARPGRPPR